MFSFWSDRLTFISLCCLVFVLPATIAGVTIFSSLAIFFFLAKKLAAVSAGCKDACKSRRWKPIFSSLALPSPAALVSIPVGIFILVCFLSIFMSVEPFLSVEGFVGKTMKTALLFFAVQECMTTPSRVTWFLRVCLVSAFILCLDGLWQHYSGVDIFKHYAMMDGRTKASFGHPNGLGAYLIVVIPVFFVLAFGWAARAGKDPGGRVLRWLVVMAAAAVFMGVMGFTFARSAWLGLGCAGIAFLAFDKKAWFSCLVIAGIFLAVFYPLLIQRRHVTLIMDNVGAARVENMGGSGRIKYWQDAGTIIADHPVFGTGLNTYTKVIKENVTAKQNYAHNCYLQVMAELGVVGLAALLGVFGAVFIFVRRKILAEALREERLPLIALMAGWVGLLINSSLDNTLYSLQLSALFWIMMGLIVSFPSTGNRGDLCSRK